MNPVQVLREGAAELAAILGPNGFAFVETGSGLGAAERRACRGRVSASNSPLAPEAFNQAIEAFLTVR
jgi:hypothetical protein